MADDIISITDSPANSAEMQVDAEAQDIIPPPLIKLEDDEEHWDDYYRDRLSNMPYPLKSESGSPTPEQSSRKRSHAEIEGDSMNPSPIGELNHCEANKHHDIGSNPAQVVSRDLISAESDRSRIDSVLRHKKLHRLLLLLKKFYRSLIYRAGRNQPLGERHIRRLRMLRRWIWLRYLSMPIDNAQEKSMAEDGRVDKILHQNDAYQVQETVERGKSEAEYLRQQLTETKVDLTSKQDRIKVLEQTQHDLEKDLEEEEKAKAELKLSNDEHQEQSRELKDRICEVENDLATETNNHSALKENHHKLNEKYEHTKKVNRIIVGNYDEHVEKYNALNEKCCVLSEKHIELQKRAEDIAKERNEIKSQNEEIAQKYTELEKHAAQVQQQLGIEIKQRAQLQTQVADLKNDFAASQHTKDQTPDARIAQLMSGLSSEIVDYILNSGSDVKTVSTAASACAAECMSENARNLAAKGQLEPTHIFCCVVWQHLLKLFMTQNYFGGISRGASVSKSAAQFVNALGFTGFNVSHSEKAWLRKMTGLLQSRAEVDLKSEQEQVKKRIGTEIEKALTSIAGVRHLKPQKDALKSILDSAQLLTQILWEQDDPYFLSMFLAPKGQVMSHRFDPSSMEDINAHGDAERMDGCLTDLVVTPTLVKRTINKKNNASEEITIVKAKVFCVAIEKLHQQREDRD